MKKPQIVVVGSTNMDFVAWMERLPKWGETALGDSFQTNPGGKGANQAVACARLGAETIFITCLGKDNFGDELLKSLNQAHVNTHYIKRIPKIPSGIAFINVSRKGLNQITVIPGSNHYLTPNDIRDRKSIIQSSDIVLLQLEIPIETVRETIKIASQKNIPIILNPAPATKLDRFIFKNINFLTPNEIELEQLTGIKIQSLGSIEKAANLLLGKGMKNIIVTLGDKGAIYFSKREIFRIPAPKVNTIDTTAAGDAFNGGLAYSLAQGNNIRESIQFANFVGALSTTRQGAQQSMPTLSEVTAFIENFNKLLQKPV